MTIRNDFGVSYDPRPGTAGDSSPGAAVQWLDQWAKIGGSITIGIDRRVTPWRLIPADWTETHKALAESLANELLRELDTTPGLLAACRIVTSERARQLMNFGLKGMGKEPRE